jgi:hypothetical protein
MCQKHFPGKAVVVSYQNDLKENQKILDDMVDGQMEQRKLVSPNARILP